MTIHIKLTGSEVTHSLALRNDIAAELWSDFQAYLKSGEPSGRAYALSNGRQELAIRFASIATMTKTTGDERRTTEE